MPKEGLYDDIMIQFVHDGMVRRTLDIKLNEGIKKKGLPVSSFEQKGHLGDPSAAQAQDDR